MRKQSFQLLCWTEPAKPLTLLSLLTWTVRQSSSRLTEVNKIREHSIFMNRQKECNLFPDSCTSQTLTSGLQQDTWLHHKHYSQKASWDHRVVSVSVDNGDVQWWRVWRHKQLYHDNHDLYETTCWCCACMYTGVMWGRGSEIPDTLCECVCVEGEEKGSNSLVHQTHLHELEFRRLIVGCLVVARQTWRRAHPHHLDAVPGAESVNRNIIKMSESEQHWDDGRM